MKRWGKENSSAPLVFWVDWAENKLESQKRDLNEFDAEYEKEELIWIGENVQQWVNESYLYWHWKYKMELNGRMTDIQPALFLLTVWYRIL